MTSPTDEELVARLREPIIADAMAAGQLTNGILAERIINERGEAAARIEALSAISREREGWREIESAEVFVSASCEGERCRCGTPAVRKIGEEIAFDDPNPHRHNLTAYVCAPCFANLLGPVAARSVGLAPAPPSQGGE